MIITFKKLISIKGNEKKNEKFFNHKSMESQ